MRSGPSESRQTINRTDASRRRLQAAALLALLGANLSVYLAMFQYGALRGIWDPFFDGQSSTVLNAPILRPVSRLLGIPVHDAILGAASYACEAILATVIVRRSAATNAFLSEFYAALVLLMGAVSVGLIVVQGSVLHAWCTLCLGSAMISGVVAFVSRDEIGALLCRVAGSAVRERWDRRFLKGNQKHDA